MKFSNLIALSALASASAFAPLPIVTNGSQSAQSQQLYSSTSNNLGPSDGKSIGVTSKTSEWEISQISPNVQIQGQTRHTWNMADASKEVVQVALHSNGRPIQADLQVWIGPDWTPVTIHAKSEDGSQYPIQTLIGTRNKAANLEVMNTGPYTMPIKAAVSYAIDPLANARDDLANDDQVEGQYMEGGSIHNLAFAPNINQLQILLKTEGKQLNARVELLNGPSNVKASLEVFTNNGALNSLFVVFDTPGAGNAIVVKNLAPLEYPCEMYAKASEVETVNSDGDGGVNWGQ
uniref:Uncharacterized protein n=1 Tax=Chaetoceros debilis TaxID=122233 RepID=A0A7S3V9T3_9STRA|mmetsp:Transcript_26977/g.41317  ORF Transcript_26977/g.41317 Transcript_26977/m.41317 type:complete len:291 (-) Transcript_26977:258-1130(-)